MPARVRLLLLGAGALAVAFAMLMSYFLTRTLGRVSTEMSLHVLAYNLKRMMKIMGTGPLIAAMRT